MFYRDCEACKKYFHDKTGLIKDALGRPIERGKSQKVNCKYCKKYDTETGEAWNGFKRRNKYYFEVFQIAEAFHVLPREGGIDKQDPYTMDILVLLHEIFTRRADLEDKNFQLKLANSMTGVR